ncbi:MAG: hypothetical protein KGS72_23390 [Cyanobacteria bacterium REEB67]|nr:hypothetical protein [Cyanobacteria bacterium REEB67]
MKFLSAVFLLGALVQAPQGCCATSNVELERARLLYDLGRTQAASKYYIAAGESFAGAAQSYKAVTKDQPRNYDAHLGLASTYWQWAKCRDGDPLDTPDVKAPPRLRDRALEENKKALLLNPEGVQALALEGYIHQEFATRLWRARDEKRQNVQIDLGVVALRHALVQDPRDWHINLALCRLYELRAIDLYKYPERSLLWWKEAVQSGVSASRESSLEQEPALSLAEDQEMLADTYMRLGNLRDGRECFKAAIDVCQKFVDQNGMNAKGYESLANAWLDLAHAQIKFDDTAGCEEALKNSMDAYDSVQRINPNASLWRQKGTALYERAQLEKAQKKYDSALRSLIESDLEYSKQWKLHNNVNMSCSWSGTCHELAEMYQQSGDDQRALRFYKKEAWSLNNFARWFPSLKPQVRLIEAKIKALKLKLGDDEDGNQNRLGKS